MSRRLWRTLAVCALLVVAGCAGSGARGTPALPFEPSTATPSPGTDAQASEGVVVEGGSLGVDVNRTYERVQGLLGEEYNGTRVVVRDLTSYKTSDYDAIPLFRVLGVSDASLDTDQPAALTTYDSTVYVSPAGAGPRRIEQVLAHEFVHVAQVREEMVPWFGELSLSRVTLDERMARRSLVEGGAVYVTDVYTKRYLEGVQLQSESVEESYEAGPAGNRIVWSQYHFGYEYVAATIDDPANLEAVYDDPPATTENVLHPNQRDEPVPLDVTVEEVGYEQIQSRTVNAGELVLRIVLRQDVGKRTAIEASEGWGNDRVVVFADDHDEHIAWVTRWDTRQDADEFEAAAANLGTGAVRYNLRVVRHDPTTVVVFGGTPEFIEAASVSGNVTVTA